MAVGLTSAPRLPPVVARQGNPQTTVAAVVDSVDNLTNPQIVSLVIGGQLPAQSGFIWNSAFKVVFQEAPNPPAAPPSGTLYFNNSTNGEGGTIVYVDLNSRTVISITDNFSTEAGIDYSALFQFIKHTGAYDPTHMFQNPVPIDRTQTANNPDPTQIPVLIKGPDFGTPIFEQNASATFDQPVKFQTDETGTTASTWLQNIQLLASRFDPTNPTAQPNWFDSGVLNPNFNGDYTDSDVTEITWSLQGGPESTVSTATRFTPKYWTCALTDGMTGSLITTSSNSISAVATFNTLEDCMMIQWLSQDTFSHPLLAYVTNNDYSNVTLEFTIEQSANLPPLNLATTQKNTFAVVDALGNQYYIDLGSHIVATYSTQSVTYSINFNSLTALDGSTISPTGLTQILFNVVPPGYNGFYPPQYNGGSINEPLPGGQIVTSFAVAGITVTGSGAPLVVGSLETQIDRMLGITTAYGQFTSTAQYTLTQNMLTPQRIADEIYSLGYTGRVTHFLGSSHYYDTVWNAAENRLVAGTYISAGAQAWHTDFFARLYTNGLKPVVSISFEMDYATCPTGWAQQDYYGYPASTGYRVPVYLLRMNDSTIQTFITNAIVAFVNLLPTGCPKAFQIAEPAWGSNFPGTIDHVAPLSPVQFNSEESY